jgi:hypothetical protein
MINSLPRCDQCNSPVTDSIEIEIENHGRVKLGKSIGGSWTCDDCIAERTGKEKSSSTISIQDDSNSVHHEHMKDASKSDVSPNTPAADEAD